MIWERRVYYRGYGGQQAGVFLVSGGAWQTSAAPPVAFDADNTGFQNYGVVQRIEAAQLSNTGGSQVRLTLLGPTALQTIIDALYIAEASAAGDLYDAAATPVQIMVGASGSFTLGFGTTTVTDAATFSITGTKALLIMWHCANSGASNIYYNADAGQVGYSQYEKGASNDASTADKTGYSGPNATKALLVSKVESLV